MVRAALLFTACWFLLQTIANAQAACTSAPRAATGLSWSVSNGQVSLLWTAPTTGCAADDYVIAAGLSAGLSNVAVMAVNATTFSTEAPPGTYFVRVFARNRAGTASASNEVTVVVPAPCTTAPLPPTGFATHVQGRTVRFTWSAPTGPCQPTGYRLDAGRSPGANDLAQVRVTSTTFEASVPDGTYYVRVMALGPGGISGPSGETEVVVYGACQTAPEVPRGFTRTITGSRVRFAWSSPTTGCDAQSYDVVARRSPGGDEVARLSVRGREVEVEAPTGTFHVEVYARNIHGVSGASRQLLVPVNTAPQVLAVDRASLTMTASSDTRTLLMGTVRNASNAPLAFVKINATFRGPGGMFRGSDWTYASGFSRRLRSIITDTTLGPGERGCFVMYADVAPASVTSVEVTATGDTGTMSELEGNLHIGPGLLRTSSGDRLRLDGEVLNRGPRLGYFVQPILLVQSPAGQVLDCDWTFVDGISHPLSSGIQTDTAIAAGSSAPFRTFTQAPAAGNPSVESWVVWDEASPAAAFDGIAPPDFPSASPARSAEPAERSHARRAREQYKEQHLRRHGALMTP